jgi:hypothetical protein
MGTSALFLSLWRILPHWEIGEYSMKVNWALTPEASCEKLLRAYHNALDNKYSPRFNQWLDEKLEPGRSSMTVRMAILRYFSLRAERARLQCDIYKRGPGLIREVLTVSRQLGPREKRAAVFLMECLRHRQEMKLFMEQDIQAGTKRLEPDEMNEKAWEAFRQWWELSPRERAEHEPLEGTGIEIGSP